MTNDDTSQNVQMTTHGTERPNRHSDLVISSTFDTRHSTLAGPLITTSDQLADLVRQLECADRVALDTEADSLHSYREKLCLLQISMLAVAGVGDVGPDLEIASASRDHPSPLQHDAIVDPLAGVDLEPLRR